MEGKLLVVVLLVAISIGYCSCQLAHDCHGNYYNETLSVDQLRHILESEEEFPTYSPIDMVVARLLAETEDKEQLLYGRATISDLLQLTRDYPDLRFCNRNQFESFDRTCQQVAHNEYLAKFCEVRIGGLRFRCTYDAFVQFRDHVKSWPGHEEFVKLSKEVLLHNEQHGNPWDSNKKVVNDYLHAAWNDNADDERQDKFVELCTEYISRMNMYVLYFDENAEITFKSFRGEAHQTEVRLLNYCTIVNTLQSPENE